MRLMQILIFTVLLSMYEENISEQCKALNCPYCCGNGDQGLMCIDDPLKCRLDYFD